MSRFMMSHINTIIRKAACCNFLINTYEDEYRYLKGNVVQGKVIYPFAAALVAVWDTFAMSVGAKKKNVSVQFREVHLYCQPILNDYRQLKLYISLNRGNGQFDILDDGSKVASGFITSFDNEIPCNIINQSNQLNIDSEEVYNNLESRGYGYGDAFKSIHRVNEAITEAELLWNDNCVVMIDGMLQLNTLKHSYSGVSQPYQIRELTIDVENNYKAFRELSDGTKVAKVQINPVLDSTSCGGIVLKNIKFRNVAIETRNEFILELTPAPPTTGKRSKIIRERYEFKDVSHSVLQISNVGDLNSLHWEEVANISSPGIKVQVHYAGLNVVDTKRAFGVIPFAENELQHGNRNFGMDFSGLTESGVRVMGLVKNGAISTAVTALPDLLWPVPSHWSLEDAATVPLAYALAFYCLRIKNKLEKSSNVLIHGGAGALGQAAISIALAMGCKIFTTVADQSKKRFLQKIFPQLPEEFIGNSRDSSFADIVLDATKGEGCEIILCCVKGDLRNECLKCTAYLGTTVDTSLLKCREDFVYGMSYMTKCRSYMTVDFNSLLETNSSADIKNLQLLVSEGIARGYVRPLSRVTFAPNESVRAFHLLAASRHRGRVLLRLRDQQPPTPTKICLNQCHVIFCDGDLNGLQLADRLVARGATSLRIHCVDPLSRLDLKIRFWKNLGVKVKASFGKILTYDEILKILKEENEVEQVEGIYMTITNKYCNSKEITSLVNYIDAVSRVSCPYLKYFAVASDTNTGKQTYMSRSTDRLPATSIINIPDLKRVNKEFNLTIDDFTWNRIKVDTIERALQSDYPVLIAKPQRLQQLSLLQQLGNITGIDNLSVWSEDTTLRDLCIENEELDIIKLYLHDVYSIYLEMDDILNLTKNKICQIELNIIGESFKDNKGLSNFFSYVDKDELRGTTDLVVLDTLVTSLIGNELDLKDKYLCIVPGMEGHHDRFRSMCEALKLPAVVLQPGLDFLIETPKELAQRYSKVIFDKLGLKDTFYILGFECGVAVALELAAILEAHEKTGTVFCLGDAPDGIRAQVEDQLAEFATEEALQVGIITHMFRLMSVEDTALLASVMKDCSSWEERVRAAVSVLLGRVSHSAQYVKSVLEAVYIRVNKARTSCYTPQKLRSKIVLMRSKSANTSPISELLQQFSEQPVDVYELAAPLAYATKDLRCAAIINRHLSEDILESYAKCNLCVSYAMDE